jgi:hypothetical protein
MISKSNTLRLRKTTKKKRAVKKRATQKIDKYIS